MRLLLHAALDALDEADDGEMTVNDPAETEEAPRETKAA